MTLDHTAEAEAADTATETPSIGELSFTDYEKVRRGEGLSKAAAVKQSAPAAKAEQKESETSGTLETEEKEESEIESEGKESEETEAKDTETEKPKRKAGFQRRIDKLNAAKAAAQQEAEYWKREALKRATGQKTEPKTDTPAAKPEATAGKPKADDFESHAEYVEALTDWKVGQAEKAREEREAKSRLENEHKTQVQTYVERRVAFQAKTPDFDEVMEGVEHVRLSPAVESVLLSAENGPELAYELAKNAEELARICKLAPLAAATEIGKLTARLASRTSEDKKPETKKITNAAKPLDPVKAGGKGTVAKSLDDPSLSFSEYEKMRREQMKRRRG